MEVYSINTYDIPDSYAFTLLWKDRKLCHVKVNGEAVEAEAYPSLEEFPTYKMMTTFITAKKRIMVDSLILTRTVPETNPNWQRIFGRVGLKEYKPYAYVRILHGVINLDGLWMFFDDEDDLEFRPPMYAAKGCTLY